MKEALAGIEKRQSDQVCVQLKQAACWGLPLSIFQFSSSQALSWPEWDTEEIRNTACG